MKQMVKNLRKVQKMKEASEMAARAATAQAETIVNITTELEETRRKLSSAESTLGQLR